MFTLTKHQKTAVRAVFKFLSISTRGWAYAESCDRTYDAGEWSGSAWADNWENEQKRVIDVVAARFEVPNYRLAEWVSVWPRVEEECFMATILHTFTRGIPSALEEGS